MAPGGLARTRAARLGALAVLLPGLVVASLVVRHVTLADEPVATSAPTISHAVASSAPAPGELELLLDGHVGVPADRPPEAPVSAQVPREGREPAGQTRATRASAHPPGGRGVWAVVVGINDYPGHDADLRNAVNDAREVVRLLDRMGAPANQRVVLLEGDATAGNVVGALDWLVANAGPDASAVVFYAGHVRKLAPGREAFVGSDGGELVDTEVARRLSPLQAKRTWLLIAACYAEGFDEAMAPGRILTAASRRDELAYEDPQMGRSYLVEYLVRRAVLQGRADDSVEQAFAWTVDALRRDHPHRVPVQHDAVDGAFPIDEQGDGGPTCMTLPLVRACEGIGASSGSASRTRRAKVT